MQSARSTVRRTQLERRESTRARLLESTLGCIVKLGYARATTTEIVRAAGLSQGALFKYFPTKAALLAAAVEHLFAGLVEGYRRDFAALPKGADRAAAGFDLLWSIFKSPELTAAFELYMAARTDRELARELEPVVRRHRAALVSHARELFPEAARDNPAFNGFVDLLMCSMEGIVIEQYGAGPVGDAALERLKALALAALGASSAPRRKGSSKRG